MDRKEEQIKLLKKYDKEVKNIYSDILKLEKNTDKKSQLKAEVKKVILKGVTKDDN